MEVVKFLPQERASSIVEQLVVCQCHRSWRKCGGDTACAYRRRADWGFPNATDHREIVEVFQLVVNAHTSRMWRSATDQGRNHGVFSWHVCSDDLSDEPSVVGRRGLGVPESPGVSFPGDSAPVQSVSVTEFLHIVAWCGHTHCALVNLCPKQQQHPL